MPQVRGIVWLVVVMLVACTTTARGDGMYFPSKLAARDPSIPHQTALISYRNGVETMVVQSTVNADGDEVGWVLPLPAPPTSIETATPGTLVTLEQLVQPRVIEARELTDSLAFAIFTLLALAFMFAVSCVLHGQRSATVKVAGYVAALPVMLVLAAAILLPILGRARQQAAADGSTLEHGVTMLMRADVGSYDVTVIAAESGKDVRTWLDANNFTCSAEAGNTIDAYVAEGWCFAAARIRWSPDGELSPHPLKVTFPADEAVYPMRLTGASATEPLALDLFVVGDLMADSRDLDLWRCEALQLDPKDPHTPADEPPIFSGGSSRLQIGHPGITSLMWDGATLTHLRGSLTPAQMTRDDVHFIWGTPQPYRRTVYSKSAATKHGAMVSMYLAALTLFIASLAALPSRWPLRQTRKRVLWPGLAIAILATPGFVVFAPSARTVVDEHPFDRRNALTQMQLKLWDMQFDASSAPASEKFITDLHAGLPDHLVWGDVPYGVVIDETETGWDVSVYDTNALPMTVHLDRTNNK